MGRKEDIETALKLRDDPSYNGPLSPKLRKKYEMEQEKMNYLIYKHTGIIPKK